MQIRSLPGSKEEVRTEWQKGSSQQLCIIQIYPDSAMNSTGVNWYFEQHLKWYPWERLPAIANDKIFGPFMEQSLDKLKALVETNNN